MLKKEIIKINNNDNDNNNEEYNNAFLIENEQIPIDLNKIKKSIFFNSFKL